MRNSCLLWTKRIFLSVECTVCTHTLIWHAGCNHSDVALRIPLGDRPRHEDIDVEKADGLNEMVELMRSLWDEDAKKRKTFKGTYISEDVAFLYLTKVQTEGIHTTVVRPSSIFGTSISECCGVTGHVFSRHSSHIAITVDKVLTILVRQMDFPSQYFDSFVKTVWFVSNKYG